MRIGWWIALWSQGEKKKKPAPKSGLKGILAATYSPTELSPAVPSAQEVLTTEFGMGSGVTPPAMPPRNGETRQLAE